jgi:hypothetical protein
MIFIGASPILEEEILELKKKRANYFILASDTSCYFMYKNDLLPDAYDRIQEVQVIKDFFSIDYLFFSV